MHDLLTFFNLTLYQKFNFSFYNNCLQFLRSMVLLFVNGSAHVLRLLLCGIIQHLWRINSFPANDGIPVSLTSVDSLCEQFEPRSDSKKCRAQSWCNLFDNLMALVEDLFVLLLYVPVNSYGHGGTVSSPYHTFSSAGLNKRLTSNSCTYFRLLLTELTTTPLEWISRREENDRSKYFMNNLHESMGPGRDWTLDPWICSQTHICSQTPMLPNGLRRAGDSWKIFSLNLFQKLAKRW